MLVLRRASPWHQTTGADTSKQMDAQLGNAPVRGEVFVPRHASPYVSVVGHRGTLKSAATVSRSRWAWHGAGREGRYDARWHWTQSPLRWRRSVWPVSR